MTGLFDFFGTQKRALQQQREIKRLQQELAELRSENASMRDGMRRCLSCDYRIDFKNRQGLEDPQEPS